MQGIVQGAACYSVEKGHSDLKWRQVENPHTSCNQHSELQELQVSPSQRLIQFLYNPLLLDFCYIYIGYI